MNATAFTDTSTIDISADDFTLFGLRSRFELDRDVLDTRWRELQSQVHPDRHVGRGAQARRVVMQQSVRVNEAYRRLRDPLRRAIYLCELRGAPVDTGSSTAMPTAFLMHQMQWREALDDATTIEAMDVLDRDVASTREALMAQAAAALDGPDGRAADAVPTLRALMFVERFRDDLDARRHALNG
jgi:molecular chaperone HscB